MIQSKSDRDRARQRATANKKKFEPRLMFGLQLAALRQSYGLTQRMLATKTGIARAVISHYELGRREPDFETLIRFADYFRVSVNYLLGREVV